MNLDEFVFPVSLDLGRFSLTWDVFNSVKRELLR